MQCNENDRSMHAKSELQIRGITNSIKENKIKDFSAEIRIEKTDGQHGNKNCNDLIETWLS